MSRLVFIPDSSEEIQEAIVQKNEQLVWWLDKLNRSRKNSLRSMRSLQVDVVRQQIAELEKAFKKVRLDEAVKALGSLVNDEGKRTLPWGRSQVRL